jgi:hypothetical protein
MVPSGAPDFLPLLPVKGGMIFAQAPLHRLEIAMGVILQCLLKSIPTSKRPSIIFILPILANLQGSGRTLVLQQVRAPARRE